MGSKNITKKISLLRYEGANENVLSIYIVDILDFKNFMNVVHKLDKVKSGIAVSNTSEIRNCYNSFTI